MAISEHQQKAQWKVLGRFRLLSAALVLFLHLAFLLALKGMPLPRPQVQTPRLAPTVLVLLPSMQAPITPPPRPERSLPIEPTPKERFPPLPMASSPAAAPGPVLNHPEPQATAAPGPAASEVSKPLNLSLSREALRALPPAATPWVPPPRLPLTTEQRIAKTLALNASGPWVEERLDIDHVRYRNGDLCITYTRPVTSALFPFDAYAQRVPWSTPGVQACPN